MADSQRRIFIQILGKRGSKAVPFFVCRSRECGFISRSTLKLKVYKHTTIRLHHVVVKVYEEFTGNYFWDSK